MSNEQIVVSVVEDSGSTNKLIASVEKLAGSSDKLASSTEKTKTATDRNAASAANAARAVGGAAGSYDSLSKAVGGVRSAFGGLTSVFASVGTYLGGEKLIKYADTYTEIRNRLQLVTKTQSETNQAMTNSFNIAQQTRQGFEETAGVYGRVNEALKNINGTSATAASITKSVAQAVALSGSSADAAKNGLTQFQQGLASGALRGDEFNSVMENTPGLARAIADGLGVPIGKLRSLAEAGELTSAKLVGALEKVAPKLDAAFANTAPTVAQAFTVIENSLMNYVGSTNKAYGITGLLANGMISLANNMNIVAPIVATLVTGLAAIAAVSITTTIFGMVSSLVALAGAAGVAALSLGVAFAVPLGILGASLAVATGLIYAFGGSWQSAIAWVDSIAAKIPGLNAALALLKSGIAAIKGFFDQGAVAANGFATAQDIATASSKQYDTTGKLVTVTVNGLTKAVDSANKSFGDQTGTAGKAANANQAAGKAAGDAAKEYNQLGEEIKNAKEIQDDFKKKQDETNATIKAGFDRLNELSGGLRTASSSMSEFAGTTSQAFAALQQLVTASNQIVGTTELLERYGSVGQAAFSQVANAANSAATSISRANSAAASANSVNSQIKGYQDSYKNNTTPSGGDLPTKYEIMRNGRVLETIVPEFNQGPLGFSYDVGWKAFNQQRDYNAAVALIDKYRPGLTNAEVKAMLPGVAANLDLAETNFAAEDRRKSNAANTSASTSFSGSRTTTSSNPVPVQTVPTTRAAEVPSTQQGGNVFNINIQAKDADSFGLSKTQMLQNFANEIARAS